MKILLTGATGFIGSRILTGLIGEYGAEKVVALSSSKIPGVETAVYKSRDGFTLDGYDFREVEVIIHAGAFIPKSGGELDDIALSNSNILFTQELLSLPLPKLAKIIYLSSVDVYGEENVISESSRVKPNSLYGASKYYCEELISAYVRTNKLKSLMLRVGHVYGEGEEKYKKVLPVAIKNIILNKPVEIWGDGSDLRSFIYIDDVVSAVLCSIDKNLEEGVVNLVSSKAISIKTLIYMLYEVSGQPENVVSVESKHIVRNIINDNTLLMSTLLEEEKPMIDGLKNEYTYMKGLYEHNI
jgi:UDP-glucose 4-epimerase